MIDVKLFGATKVTVDGVVRTATDLGGFKPLQILTMLAVELGTPVPKDRLAEQLWETAVPERYRAILESYVCVLRRGLGVERGRGGALATTHQGYVLDPGQVRVDLAEARRLLTRAASGRGDVVAVAKRALDVAREELLLDEAYAGWAARDRDAFSALLARACTQAAMVALDSGDSAAAVGLARTAASCNGVDEGASQLLMRALWSDGRRAEALRAYADLRAATLDDVGVEPGPASQQLYLAILQDEPARQESTSGAGRREIGMLVRLLRQALESSPTDVLDSERGMFDNLRAVLLEAH